MTSCIRLSTGKFLLLLAVGMCVCAVTEHRAAAQNARYASYDRAPLVSDAPPPSRPLSQVRPSRPSSLPSVSLSSSPLRLQPAAPLVLQTAFEQTATPEPLSPLLAPSPDAIPAGTFESDAPSLIQQTQYQQTPYSQSPYQTPLTAPEPSFVVPQGFYRKPLANGRVAEVLPQETLFKEYLADPKAARFGSQILHNTDAGWIWELRAGGRAPLFRFGTPSGTVGPSGRPEGWQIGVEGVATPRLNFEQELDLDYVDYRVGVPITYQQGRWQYKFELYHLSSHAGDELLVRDPTFERINYLRDAARLAVGYFITPDWRVYGEGEVAWNTGGGSDPIHAQFGIDYSPAVATPYLSAPQPLFAANVGLRQELDYGGGVNILGGLQWRGAASDNVFRAGVQYYNGKSFQYEQFNEHEELLGLGIWYDF